jgi:hypothetical protein
LVEQYKRWYPQGTKIVPEDLELSPLTVKYWFIDDGNTSYHKDRFQRLKIATNGFSDKDRDVLQGNLAELDITTKVSKLGELYIKKSLAPLLFSYIGDCPVSCYKYKWEITNRQNYDFLKS